MRYRALILAAIAALCVSCFKEEAYDTEYRLKSLVQSVSSGELLPLAEVVTYAYNASAEQCTVASYEDAVEGKVTLAGTSQAVKPIAEGKAKLSGSDYVSMMQLKYENVMLLAVDTQNKIFAYGDYEVGLNLPTTYVTLIFRPWKTESYKEGNWFFDTTSIVIPEPEPTPDTGATEPNTETTTEQ